MGARVVVEGTEVRAVDEAVSVNVDVLPVPLIDALSDPASAKQSAA